MTGIGIIANPNSKSNKRNPQNQEILSYIAGEQGIFRATKNIAELSEVAQDFKERGIQILAINGGDGTISHTLTAFVKAYGQEKLPKFAVLGGGTINLILENLGLSGRPADILFRLIEAYSRGETLQSVTINSLHVDEFYGFFCGTGICPNFLHRYYNSRTGKLGAFMLVIKLIYSYLRDSALINDVIYDQDYLLTLSQSTLTHRSLGVLCCTLEKLPFKRRLFPKSTESFHGLSLGYSKKSLVRNFFYDFLFHPLGRQAGKIRFQDKALSISASNLTYTIDGELFAAKSSKLDIELGPQVQFILI